MAFVVLIGLAVAGLGLSLEGRAGHDAGDLLCGAALAVFGVLWAAAWLLSLRGHSGPYVFDEQGLRHLGFGRWSVTWSEITGLSTRRGLFFEPVIRLTDGRGRRRVVGFSLLAENGLPLAEVLWRRLAPLAEARLRDFGAGVAVRPDPDTQVGVQALVWMVGVIALVAALTESGSPAEARAYAAVALALTIGASVLTVRCLARYRLDDSGIEQLGGRRPGRLSWADVTELALVRDVANNAQREYLQITGGETSLRIACTVPDYLLLVRFVVSRAPQASRHCTAKPAPTAVWAHALQHLSGWGPLVTGPALGELLHAAAQVAGDPAAAAEAERRWRRRLRRGAALRWIGLALLLAANVALQVSGKWHGRDGALWSPRDAEATVTKLCNWSNAADRHVHYSFPLGGRTREGTRSVPTDEVDRWHVGDRLPVVYSAISPNTNRAADRALSPRTRRWFTGLLLFGPLAAVAGVLMMWASSRLRAGVAAECAAARTG